MRDDNSPQTTSNWSDTDATDFTTNDQCTPAAPTNFNVVVQNCTDVQLTWTDASTNEDGFKVMRGPTATGPWTEIADLPGGNPGTELFDYTQGAYTIFWYRVYAYTDPGDYKTAWTGALEGDTNDSCPINAPDNVAATEDQTGPPFDCNQMTITWDDNSLNEHGFFIEISDNAGGPWTDITANCIPDYSATPIAGDTGSGSCVYSNHPAVTQKYYRVLAHGTQSPAGVPSPSAMGSNYTTCVPWPPINPTVNSGCTTGPTTCCITRQVGWDDNTPNETGYRVEYKLSSAAWGSPPDEGCNIGGGSGTFSCMVGSVPPVLLPKENYDFRIIAYNGAGDSTPANISGTTPALCQPVLSFVEGDCKCVHTQWTILGVESDVDEYEIRKDMLVSGTWILDSYASTSPQGTFDNYDCNIPSDTEDAVYWVIAEDSSPGEGDRESAHQTYSIDVGGQVCVRLPIWIEGN
jgi:hypothetical protein